MIVAQRDIPPPAGDRLGGGHESGDLSPDARLPSFPLWGEKFKDRLRPNADLSKTNWFGVGGRAEWLFKPKDAADLSDFLKALPRELPVTVLGVGSNVIVRDGGIAGVVVKLGRGFTTLSTLSLREREAPRARGEGPHPPRDARHPLPEGEGLIAGAACLDVHLAQFACEQGIAGLEFFSGIPGTVGGAVRMNAGAYGGEVSQALVEAEIVERDGTIRVLRNGELGFSYRHSALPEGAIVTSAVFRGREGKKEEIARRIAEIQAARGETQPIRSRTGGSTFKNPPGAKAWELIEKAGCRGLKIGGAQVSEQHCNFLINTGNATAADLENLGEEVIRRVKESCGVELEWEIERVGNP